MSRPKENIIDMPEESDMLADAMKEVFILITAGQVGSR